MDSAIHAPATQLRRIRRIDHGIAIKLGYIPLDNLNTAHFASSHFLVT